MPASQTSPQGDRPNILLLHTDQQRFDTIAALGAPAGASHVRTPNLDRLVQRGTSFTRAYSSCPVCQPARHDLITGVSARHHGYFGNRKGPIADYRLPTIPRILSENGYQTLAVGKMHFWPQRMHHGFSHMFLMEELPNSREDDAYVQYLAEQGLGDIRCQHGVRPLFYHTPQPSRVPEEHHGSAWVATKTIELMRQERHRPFFLFASWVGPHPPYYVPQRYLDLYRDADVPTPCAPTETTIRQAPVSPENPAPGSERMRRIQESYYAAITFIDAQIGRILDELETLGLDDNTVILFTTDHGEMLGDLGGYQKHVPYEGSAHIPLIAAGPGFGADVQSATPAATWDTSATILAAAGLPAPDGHPMIGTDLARLAGSATSATAGAAVDGSGRIVAFHHGGGTNRYVATTTSRYKFVHWYNGGQEELYDLTTDPWEQQNIVTTQTSVADTLRTAAIEFEATHGQAERIADGRFVDQPYQAPDPHSCSLYPLWSSNQFPPWPEEYDDEDLRLIAGEIDDCIADDAAYICTERPWREDAVEKWKAIGGDPAVYGEIFKKTDRKQ